MTWRSTWASSGPAAKSTPWQNRTFGLATITKDHVTVTKGQLVFEYLAKGPSSMSRSWQGSRLIEEEMRHGGHRTLRGRPVCHVH